LRQAISIQVFSGQAHTSRIPSRNGYFEAVRRGAILYQLISKPALLTANSVYFLF
jgi:hypothetical protein